MKQFALMTLLGLFVIIANASTVTHATSIVPNTILFEAELITWDFDVASDLRDLDVKGGQVTINPITKVASATFNLANNCPPNAYCMPFITAYKIELPIKKISKDSCGVVTYVAKRNMMPADGVFEKLVIKDTSSSMCDTFYPAATLISYDETFMNRLEHRTETRRSRMTAEKLQLR